MKQDLQKEQFDRFSVDFPEDVRQALWDLLQCPHFDQKLSPTEGKLKFEVDSGTACIRYLTLHQVSCVPEEADWLVFESLIKHGEEYRLIGEAMSHSTDETKLFTIHFTHAEVDTQVCRADTPWQEGKPWETLVFMAFHLMVKFEISPKLLNASEQAILPLLADLSRLSHYAGPEGMANDSSYPRLRELFEKHGAKELLPILSKLGKSDDPKVRDRYLQKLFAGLDTGRYEPLFRHIWNQIQESQQAYPTRSQLTEDFDDLPELRNRIQMLMEHYGYSGSYPDFYQKLSVKGVRMGVSYGKDYSVMGEKNVYAYIHFNEICLHRGCFELICGTQLLKKKQDRGDYLSCTFNTKGKTFCSTVLCEADQLNIVLPIADKLAQLKPLTKEERKLRTVEKLPLPLVFFAWFIIGGGCFAILGTAITLLACYLFLSQSGDLQILRDVPWPRIFLFCWSGFGGLMGIVMTYFEKLK